MMARIFGRRARTGVGQALKSALAMALATGTVLSSGQAAGKEAEHPTPMNVLFLIADDLRTGGAFGSTEVRTPNFDRLAARGVRFNQAYSQFPLCGPSRASLLTGLRPNSVRVYDLATPIRSNVPDVVTLPQLFRQHGYFTARIGKLFHQGVPGGIGKMPDPHDDPQSWDLAENPKGRDKVNENDRQIVNLTPRLALGIAFAYRADEGEDEDQTDGMVATRTIELIEANKHRPFFIAAGFYRPHVPEIAPKKYFDLYPQVRFTPEAPERMQEVLPASRGIAYNYTGKLAQSLPVDQQVDFVRSYYAATTFLDAQVGRVLDALDKSGVADRTIVVLTSDHGFSLGEHGSWQKLTLWDESTRVPMVVYAPGAKGNGQVSDRVVELLDLYPTLADLAGLQAPQQVEGHSMKPLLARPNDRAWDHPALSQVGGGQSVRYRNWRYSEWGKDGAQGIELYDLARDPQEYRNLAAEPRHRKLIKRLKAMLPGDPPPSTGPKVPAE